MGRAQGGKQRQTAVLRGSAPTVTAKKSEPLSTVASLRRRLSVPGVEVTLLHSRPRPESIGVTRKVEEVLSNQVIFAAGPNYPDKSYLYFPKAKEFQADSDDDFTVLDEQGEPLLSYRIEPEIGDPVVKARQREELAKAKEEAIKKQEAEQKERAAQAEVKDRARRAEYEERQERERAERERQRLEAEKNGTFFFNNDYKDLDQIAEYYPQYEKEYERLQAAEQFPSNASFKGKIPSLEGTDTKNEETAIYLLQVMRSFKEGEQKFQELLDDGYKPLDYEAEPHERVQFKEIVTHETDMHGSKFGWRTFEGARVVFDENGKPRAILPKGKRTNGYRCGNDVLVR